MGNYNPVYKSIWQSRKFTKLSSTEKLVYLNLITNKQTSQTGIFNIMPQYVACDCSLDIKEVIEILKSLDNLQMIRFLEDENLIYIHKFFKYTKGMIKNPVTIAKSLLREFELLNNYELQSLFSMEFNHEIHEIEIALQKNMQQALNEDKKKDIEDLIEKLNALLINSQ